MGKPNLILGSLWAAFGQPLGNLWAAFGQPLGNFWATFGQLLGSLWIVCLSNDCIGRRHKAIGNWHHALDNTYILQYVGTDLHLSRMCVSIVLLGVDLVDVACAAVV